MLSGMWGGGDGGGSHSKNEGLNSRGGFLLSLACSECLRVPDPEPRVRAWVWLQRATGWWRAGGKAQEVLSRSCCAHVVPVEIAENWP